MQTTFDLLFRLQQICELILIKNPNGKIGKSAYESINIYLAALENTLTDIYGFSPEDLSTVLMEGTKSEFDSTDLRRIFKLRLKTQDRICGSDDNVIYPIYFINKVYRANNKSKEFSDLLESLIDGIVFHSINKDGKKTSYQMSHVKSLRIDMENHRAYFKTEDKNDEHLLRDPESEEPLFVADGMKTISIDHKALMSDSLKSLKNGNSQIEKIANELKGNKVFVNRKNYLDHIKTIDISKRPKLKLSDEDFKALAGEIRNLNEHLRLMALDKNIARTENS